MTTMLERAAAAAWPHLWDATDTTTPAHEAARAKVRATLQALRDPDQIDERVREAGVDDVFDEYLITPVGAACVFTAMIGAILDEASA